MLWDFLSSLNRKRTRLLIYESYNTILNQQAAQPDQIIVQIVHDPTSEHSGFKRLDKILSHTRTCSIVGRDSECSLLTRSRPSWMARSCLTAAALVSQRQMTLRTNSISLQAEQSFYCSEVFRFDINSLIFKFVFLSFSSLICYSNAVTWRTAWFASAVWIAATWLSSLSVCRSRNPPIMFLLSIYPDILSYRSRRQRK